MDALVDTPTMRWVEARELSVGMSLAYRDLRPNRIDQVHVGRERIRVWVAPGEEALSFHPRCKVRVLRDG